MNKSLEFLHPYPFEKLNALFKEASPPTEFEKISLAIGEPKHEPPPFIKEALLKNIDAIAQYPATKGNLDLRSAICEWASQRFKLTPGSLDADKHVLPVNGTREALFAFAQAVIDRTTAPTVIMPNPFYQIYEGAAILAGAKPIYLDCNADKNFLPDFGSVDSTTWERCQLVYLCSPGNPTGAVIDLGQMQALIEKADRYDFIIASDECYSEIYQDESNPPPGLLEACKAMGRDDYARCVVFHSLSKRSNLPGLRSGFVAGDAQIIKQFLKYRTYHGCAMPIHNQIASIAAWSDEAHVVANRALYREKFSACLSTLSDKIQVYRPEAGFYLWAKTPISDEIFSRELYQQQHVVVLPGQYLGRGDAHNPGKNYVRIALVSSLEKCIEAIRRMNMFIDHY